MKSTLSTLALSLALVLPAYAQETPAAGASAMPEPMVKMMRDNAARMQKQVEAMASAKEPAQQQKLLMEHMQTLRENMMLGQQMAAARMDCPMMGGMGMMQGMGGGMGGGMGMMMGPDGAATPDTMVNRMHQMERRMDMMQMMMERMSRGTATPGRK